MQVEDSPRHSGHTLATADVLVLCYHGLSTTWPAPSAIPVERLAEQLEHLVERGYRGATFSQAVVDRPFRRTLAVTFDDALQSTEQAAPVLARLGLPGTLFVPTGWVDRPEPIAWGGFDRWIGTEHEHELAPMSWETIARLADQGWEIGSHSRTHPRLSQLDDEPLASELAESRAECEGRLGRPCTSVAYPYGAVGRRVVAAAARTGYVAGAALPVALHRRRRLEWPRVGVYRNDSFDRFRRKTSPLGRWLIGRPGMR